MDPRVRIVKKREVSFVKLARASVAAAFAASKAVIDYQRPGQAGVTMRTFEALASGAAVITANPFVRNEPFFDPSRILVVPTDPQKISSADVAQWIASTAPSTDRPAGFEDYSLDAWVGEFIDLIGSGPTQ
jgi:spore maturation protein CgeB